MSTTNKFAVRLECHHARQFGRAGAESIDEAMANGDTVTIKCTVCRCPRAVVGVTAITGPPPSNPARAVLQQINARALAARQAARGTA